MRPATRTPGRERRDGRRLRVQIEERAAGALVVSDARKGGRRERNDRSAALDAIRRPD